MKSRIKVLSRREWDGKTPAVDMPFVYLNGAVEAHIGYDQIVVPGNEPLPFGETDVEVIGYPYPCRACVFKGWDFRPTGFILDVAEYEAFKAEYIKDLRPRLYERIQEALGN